MSSVSGVKSHSNGNPAVVSKSRPSGKSPNLDKLKGKSQKSSEDVEGECLRNQLPAPIKIELNRLENELKVKCHELEKINSESKGLRQSNISMEKALVSLTEEVAKLKEKLECAEQQLDAKALEVKKSNDLKRAAFSAQAAAEATVRRFQASHKDTELPSVEAILAPLEAELKLTQKELAKLQDDNKAHERLMRAKEAALLEAEKDVEAANAKAAQVEDLMNKNHEFSKLIEICQEENKTLDRLHKQKVEEVQKLTSQVASLSEALTASGAVTSTIKDYQRQVQELQASQKVLQEELARAKVAANRVAVAVANEWKDDNDKVIPLKQWLEERRFMQGELEKVKEKLISAEKTIKYEVQMKEKLQLRIKVIEESLKSGGIQRLSTRTSLLNLKSARHNSASSSQEEVSSGASETSESAKLQNGFDRNHGGSVRSSQEDVIKQNEEDTVPGVFYEVLQREVASLRKVVAEREQSLKDRDDVIEMFSKKVELLTKALDVEAKKARRDIGALEKELALLKSESPARGPQRRLSSSASRGGISPMATSRR